VTISHKEFVEAVAILDAADDRGPYKLEMHPDVLATLRTMFTEKEIQEICLGKGPGWKKYLELE